MQQALCQTCREEYLIAFSQQSHGVFISLLYILYISHCTEKTVEAQKGYISCQGHVAHSNSAALSRWPAPRSSLQRVWVKTIHPSLHLSFRKIVKLQLNNSLSMPHVTVLLPIFSWSKTSLSPQEDLSRNTKRSFLYSQKVLAVFSLAQ